MSYTRSNLALKASTANHKSEPVEALTGQSLSLVENFTHNPIGAFTMTHGNTPITTILDASVWVNTIHNAYPLGGNLLLHRKTGELLLGRTSNIFIQGNSSFVPLGLLPVCNTPWNIAQGNGFTLLTNRDAPPYIIQNQKVFQLSNSKTPKEWLNPSQPPEFCAYVDNCFVIANQSTLWYSRAATPLDWTDPSQEAEEIDSFNFITVTNGNNERITSLEPFITGGLVSLVPRKMLLLENINNFDSPASLKQVSSNVCIQNQGQAVLWGSSFLFLSPQGIQEFRTTEFGQVRLDIDSSLTQELFQSFNRFTETMFAPRVDLSKAKLIPCYEQNKLFILLYEGKTFQKIIAYNFNAKAFELFSFPNVALTDLAICDTGELNGDIFIFGFTSNGGIYQLFNNKGKATDTNTAGTVSYTYPADGSLITNNGQGRIITRFLREDANVPVTLRKVSFQAKHNIAFDVTYNIYGDDDPSTPIHTGSMASVPRPVGLNPLSYAVSRYNKSARTTPDTVVLAATPGGCARSICVELIFTLKERPLKQAGRPYLEISDIQVDLKHEGSTHAGI